MKELNSILIAKVSTSKPTLTRSLPKQLTDICRRAGVDEKEVFFHLSTARRRDQGRIRVGARIAYRSLPAKHRDYVTGLRLVKGDR